MIQPLVSIVIPCWNAERYVGDAIESAMAQTYGHKEIIVVDDGSRDSSLSVIRGFGENVRWTSIEHKGGGAARNAGIELSRGEMVQFLDADDLLEPEKLELMVPELKTAGKKGMVLCGWSTTGTEGTKKGARKHIPGSDGVDPVYYVLSNSMQTGTPLHWRENLQGVGGFDESLPCSQERDLHVRLACNGIEFFSIPDVLYRVRKVPGRVSGDSVRVYRQHERIVLRALEILREKGCATEHRRKAMAGLLARDARMFIGHGCIQEARRYFRRAREIHPDGGLQQAYRPSHLFLARILGKVALERLVKLKRSRSLS